MMTLEEIQKDTQLINDIDWDMTPEEAVTLYLEWGNNWAHGNYVIRSKNDVSHYFVINNWDEKPVIFLVRRNSEEVKEIAKFDMPEDLIDYFHETCGNNKGVYGIDGKIKDWLQKKLDK